MFVDVSIIVPTSRRPAQLVEAIQSTLQQDCVSVEVLVLDDSPEGSARAAVEQVAHPRIKYVLRSSPSGALHALVRNEGFHVSRGRYIHFLDDDDRLAPGPSRALVNTLDHNPRAGIAFGRVVPFGEDPQTLHERGEWLKRAAQIARESHSRYHTIATMLFKGALMVNSACMIRRRCFSALGGFDPTPSVCEDVDFWMRAIRKFGHVFVDQPILEHRTGASALIHDLNGDWTPVRASYQQIQRKYRTEHGLLKYTALKLFSRLLPPVAPSTQESAS